MVQVKRVVFMASLFMVCGALLLGGFQDAAAKDIKLKYVSWMAKGEDKPVLEEFMQNNPGIVVEDEILEGSKYAQLLKTRLLAGDVPDVMLVMFKDFPEYVREGYLADLSGQPGLELQTQVPSVNDAFTVDGKVYARLISGGINVHPIWYNKKIFKQLGLEEPTTVEEFLEVCRKIKEADIEPLVFGGKDLWPYRWAQFWGLTDQVQISMQEAQTRDIWEALYKGVPAATMFKQTLELWASLVDNAYVGPTSISMSWPESSQYFVDGGAAMLPQGPWVAGLSEVNNADPEKFELGVFLFPAEPADGTRYLQAGFDRCLVVSARTKYPEEALKLFNHFASDAVLAEYLGSQTLTTLLPLEYELPPIVQKFMTDSADGPYELVSLTFPEAPGLEGELNKTFQNIQAGATVAEELERLQNFYEEHKGDIKF